MLVLFIRHAETVDNIAGVYAGVTDSELTNHGIQQARNLGTWLAHNRPPVDRVFASPLQRTRRTANAILDAQKAPNDKAIKEERLVISPLLIEQDFGSYEKTSFHALPPDSSKTRRAAHAEIHKNDPGFVDVESGTALDGRCDQFLQDLLIPAITTADPSSDSVIVVVSHGILLSHLWRRFLLRLPKKSITICAEVTAAKGQIILEHLGGWSNTGVLEISVEKQASNEDSPSKVASLPPLSSTRTALLGYKVEIRAVNAQFHLQGVKRARGGIGSARYDEGQKSLDSFFKRAKK